MRNILLTLILVILNAPAFGQSIVNVRSGEHANFSRLVINLKPPTRTVLTQTESGYKLDVGQNGIALDLSRIYDRIPKARLLSVELAAENPAILLLEVDPSHHVETFELKPGMLVVDIKIGARPKFQAKTSESASDFRVRLPELPKKDGSFLLVPAQRPTSHFLTSTEDVFRASARALAVEKKLVSQLAGAAEQNIVELLEPDTFSFDADLTESVSEPALNEHLNIDVESVFGREDNNVSDKIEVATREHCISDAMLDVENWGANLGISHEMADLRRMLSQEFDLPNASILERLSKLLIVNGLGTEAAALIHSYDADLPNEQLLLELAAIVETSTPPATGILASQADCEGASALWSILARGEIPLGEIPDSEILRTHFAILPAELRQRVGPRLGTVLLSAGHLAHARDIEKLVARIPGYAGEEFDLFQARLKLLGSREAEAEKLLFNLIGANSSNADDAIILLLQHSLKQGKPIPPNLIDEAAARAFQLRFIAKGAELRELELFARARSNDQATAFEILTHEAVLGAIEPQTAQQIARDLFLTFDAIDFLSEGVIEVFFRYRYMLTDEVASDDVRRFLAQGLMTAGLPKAGLEILAPLSHRMTNDDFVLFASLRNMAGQMPDAIKLLANINTPRADAVQIRSLQLLGAHEQALQIANRANERELASELAWRAGDWTIAAESSSETRRAAAEFMLGAESDKSGSNEEFTLRGLEGLLEQSRAGRAEIGTLLAENSRPEMGNVEN